MPAGNPLVSILLPSYNYVDFVPRAIESVLAQTYQNWELVISDDGSNDGALDVVRGYAARDARIRLLEQPVNLRLFRNLHAALAASRGEYIGMVSADDAFLPGHLENSLSYYERHPEIDVYYTSYVSMDGTGTIVGKPYQAGFHGAISYRLRDEFQQLLCWDSFMSIQAMLLKRSLIEQHGYLEPDTFKVGADYDMFIRWAKAGVRFGFEDRPGVVMRYHPNNTSGVAKFVVGGLQLHEYLLFWERHVDEAGRQRLVGRGRQLEAVLDSRISALRVCDPEHATEIITRHQPRIDAMREVFRALPRVPSQLPPGAPRVSVIVPTTGMMSFLSDALRSLDEQTYDAFEVILVGDGAPDLELYLGSLKHPERVRFVHAHAHGNPAHARNVGLRSARGDIIAYLDADNVWAAGHLSAAMDALENNPHLDTVVLGSLATLERVLNDIIMPRQVIARDPQAYAFAGQPWTSAIANRTPLNAVVHRRAMLERIGEFDPKLPVLEDWDFLLRLSTGATGVIENLLTVDVRFRDGLEMSYLGARFGEYLPTMEKLQLKYGAPPNAARAARERIAAAAAAAWASPPVVAVWLELFRALRGD